MDPIKRWMVMTVLCFSGGIIFMLPFLREVYYIPMQDAFGYTNTEMGLMMSLFGLVSLITYFPGGWLADRFSPRKLMASGLLATGLAGFYFATFPSYTVSLFIHAFWGGCVSLVFWGAMIKATRNWAPASEQGKAFGILESGRGVAETLSSSLFLLVFAWLGSNADGLAQVIKLFAATNVFLAVMTWLVIDDEHSQLPDELELDETAPAKAGWSDVVAVLKMPEVWLISIIVLTAYSAYWGSYYFTPYATDAFGLSVTLGAAIGVGKMYLKPAAALFAGILADKVGVSKAVLGFFIVLIVGFSVFGFLPGGPAMVGVMLATVVVVSMGIFALRGIYFALIEEGGIPKSMTGTAAGVISAIGFTPDVFMPLIGGVFLDNFEGVVGYQYFYLVIAALCVIGAIAAAIMLGKINKLKSGSTLSNYSV
ncbi:MAG: nitrate/nitrite transporter NarK [Parvicella sp.]